MGRANWRSSFLGDPGAKFSAENGERQMGVARGTVTDHGESKAQGSGGLSQPYIPSIVERGSERPGAVKGAALFRRGDSEPFTARTALKSWRREGKDDTPQQHHNNFQISKNEAPGERIGCRRGGGEERFHLCNGGLLMISKNTNKHNPPPNWKMPKLLEGQLELLFRRLNLAHTRRIYQDLADRAEKENWSYRDFLALLLAEEVAHRKQTRLQRCTRKAHFPFFKTIDEFDFSLQTSLRQSLLGTYLGPDFVTEGRSLILYGKAGRGKTHLAVAIGYRAIQNGFETLCTTAAELIEDLSNASKRGQLQEALLTYTHPHVLVIDEVGYLTYGPDAANVLFHVVNHRHLRKRPMIFTTNKTLSEWGKVLHDEDLAAAILDRVLERGRFIHLGGPSGRTRHLKLEEVLPAESERLRISGIDGSEFPEPTALYAQAVTADQQKAHRKVVKMVLPAKFPETLRAKRAVAKVQGY
jgi:DNA replication protein DnaC